MLPEKAIKTSTLIIWNFARQNCTTIIYFPRFDIKFIIIQTININNENDRLSILLNFHREVDASACIQFSDTKR